MKLGFNPNRKVFAMITRINNQKYNKENDKGLNDLKEVGLEMNKMLNEIKDDYEKNYLIKN